MPQALQTLLLLASALLISCARSGTTGADPKGAASESQQRAPKPPANGVTSNAMDAAPAAVSAERPEGGGRFEGTAGIVEKKSTGEPRVLGAVRAAQHTAYDRVVFEFVGAIPGYHLEYVDRPVRDCGAGDTKTVEGDGWLEVRLTPAHAHTEAGEPTVSRRELFPRLPIVRELERTCDFEAVVTWVIGTASPNRFRVLELSDPPRLVVDILH